MKIEIKETNGQPLIVETNEITAVTLHSSDAPGLHEGCGSLYLKAHPSCGPIVFHIAEADAVQKRVMAISGEVL